MVSLMHDESTRRFALRVGAWGIHVRPPFVEIYRAGREDVAHLSMFFQTHNGELDFHLTYGHEQATRGEQASKRRVQLLKVPFAKAEEAGLAAGVAIERAAHEWGRSEFRRFRPGWLRRNGYLVALAAREDVAEMWSTITPKRRGKYRVSTSWETAVANHVASFELYDPSVLHTLRAEGVRAGLMSDSVFVVTAVRPGEPVARHIALSYDTFGRDRGWWGVTHRSVLRMQRRLLIEFLKWLHLNSTPHHRDAWENVVVGLGLNETDTGRTLADNVRQVLAGRNPLTHPF